MADVIRLAVFDLAGTTVHDPDAVARCLVEAISAAGGRTTVAQANAVMGMPKPLAISQLFPGSDVASVFRDFRKRMLRFYETSDEVVEIPGTRRVFEALRERGVHVATDTGFDREIADAIYMRLGWVDLLDATICSDEVERGRPHPDMVFALMERTGVEDPRAVAKVGDTAVDLLSGEAAGCGLNIGVLTGASTRAELERHPHTHLLESVRDVPGLFVQTAVRAS